MCHCCGLLDFDNGLRLHPYLFGSGDHVNSMHVNELMYQFVNLIVKRGSNKINKVNSFFNNLSGRQFQNDEKNIPFKDLSILKLIK